MKKFDILYICTDNNATSRIGLEALHKAGHSMLVVIYELPHLRYDPKQPEELYIRPKSHRKKWLKHQSASIYCNSHSIPYFITHETNLDVLLPAFESMSFDYVLVNEWSAKLSPKIAALANIEAMNCHPSYLPEYRGGNITYAPLINKEKTSGITVHVLTEKFDAGQIIAQQRFDISFKETTKSLTFKRSLYVGDVLLEAIDKAGKNEEYKPNPSSPFWKKQSFGSYVLHRTVNTLRGMVGLSIIRRNPG